MDVFEVFDRLELDDDFVFDEKIEAMLANLVVLVKERNWFLPNESNSSNCKLNRQRLLVNGFQKTGAKLGMNRDRRANCFLRDLSIP